MSRPLFSIFYFKSTPRTTAGLPLYEYMKNRYILTPKDKRAEELLYFNEAGDHDLIQLVLSESQFYQLDAFGVFSDLNKLLGCLIDDFEDDAIMNKQQLEKGLKYLKNVRSKDDSIQELMEEIISLFEEAVIGAMLFFYAKIEFTSPFPPFTEFSRSLV